MAKAWLQGMGSESFYTSVTIDQPAKFVAMAGHGIWSGGGHSFESSDVILVVGNNPLVSVFAPYGGVPSFSPYKSLREAQRAGLGRRMGLGLLQKEAGCSVVKLKNGYLLARDRQILAFVSARRGFDNPLKSL